MHKSRDLASTLKRWLFGTPRPVAAEFPGSSSYWELRYKRGGTSGAGSYGELAHFKADVLNDFCRQHAIASVIEHGCGDGNQLKLSQYSSYLGLDVSENAIERCRQSFRTDPSKSFRLAGDYKGETAQLALSLDVIFHLVEDAVFDAYMQRVFDSATRYVIIYSSNGPGLNNADTAPHVRHRRFTDWVAANPPQWKEVGHVPNKFPYDPSRPDDTSFSEFFIYGRAAP